MITITSMVPRLEYKTMQDVLSHVDIQQVDTIFSEVLVATTRNMHGYPKKLLYMTLSCMRSHQQHSHAADGALCQLERKHGYYAIKGKEMIITLAGCQVA